MELARTLDALHRGSSIAVTGIATIADAGAGELCFVGDPERYGADLSRALAAGAVVLAPEGFEPDPSSSGAGISVANPRAAFAHVVARYFAARAEAGIAATAIVHPSAQVAATASVGEFSVIGAGVVIGDDAEVRHHVVLGSRVRIGARTLIKSHAVIGEEGFGIEKNVHGDNVRLPHLGSVVIGDDAEVGNFTTVCSGTISPTIVGDFTKIDDHVHIAHNVSIGRNAIITACAEVSGSVTIEDDVWIGPNASVIQGLTLGARSLIGMGSVVVKSVPPDEVQFGSPARKMRSKADG